MKILILTNSLLGLYSFRRELVDELLQRDYDVVVSAPSHTKADYFIGKGCKYIETNIDRRSTNPIKDVKLFFRYFSLVKSEKPDLILTYTIKPNVYGGLVCRLLRIPYIANITGLGTAVDREGILQKISLKLYKVGLARASCIFFQNQGNMNFMQQYKIGLNNAQLIPGSGVNLDYFRVLDYSTGETINFLFIGRIMKEKGIEEFLEAAKTIKDLYPAVTFHIVGSSEEQKYIELIDNMSSLKVIHFHGQQSDVRKFYAKTHALILPSYHEGLSNVLLEAAASGRPVLASNISGCKEAFDEGLSGYGFEPKNADSLVNTIIRFIKLPYQEKKQMGLSGRAKVEKEFDRQIVINSYLREIEKTINVGSTS